MFSTLLSNCTFKYRIFRNFMKKFSKSSNADILYVVNGKTFTASSQNIILSSLTLTLSLIQFVKVKTKQCRESSCYFHVCVICLLLCTDRVHITFCKQYCNLTRNTSKSFALGECRRLPLFTFYIPYCIKYSDGNP